MHLAGGAGHQGLNHRPTLVIEQVDLIDDQQAHSGRHADLQWRGEEGAASAYITEGRCNRGAQAQGMPARWEEDHGTWQFTEDSTSGSIGTHLPALTGDDVPLLWGGHNHLHSTAQHSTAQRSTKTAFHGH